MRALIAIFLCTGCTLIVGTSERTVGAEAGVDAANGADANGADAADDGGCQANCMHTLTTCQQPCHGGPAGDMCRMSCGMASMTCINECMSNQDD